MRRKAIEDSPAPARTTPARLAKELEDWAARIADLAIRGRRLGAFLADPRWDDVCTRLFRASQVASDLSLDVLVGKSPTLPLPADVPQGGAWAQGGRR